MVGSSREQVKRLRLRQAPLAAAAICLAAGIISEHFHEPPLLMLVSAFVLLSALSLTVLAYANKLSWLPLAAVWIVVGIAAAKWQPTTINPVLLSPYADGLSRRLLGTVTRLKLLPAKASISLGNSDKVAPWEASEESEPILEQATTIDLAATQIEEVTPDVANMIPAAGGVRLTAYGPPPELACGDIVETTVRLKVPERYHDPAVWQYADYLLSQGIVVRASVNVQQLRLVGKGPATWNCMVVAAQSWAVARLQRFVRSGTNRRLPTAFRLNQTDAGMLDAMLFGDRSGLTRTLRQGFERTGSFHLFVVSGLHVTLLAGGVFWAMRRFGTPLWMATLTTIAFASTYAVLTGFGQPVQRALVMTSVFLLGRLLLRHGNSVNALGAAALAMMVWAPGCIFEASFQMTVLAIMAIAGIAIPLGSWSFAGYTRGARRVFALGNREVLPPHVAQFRVMLQMFGERFAWAFGRWTRGLPAAAVRFGSLTLEMAMIGVVAELVMVLPMAMYFHRATVFALPANMVMIPVLGVLVPAAVATFVGSLVSPWVAAAPGALTAMLLHGITGIIHRISHLAVADARVPAPVWWVAGLAALGWATCCWAVRRGRWQAGCVALALPAIALMVLWPEPLVLIPGDLEVTAIDVGQGDSLLVTGPDGTSMLVDAGGPVGQHGGAEMATQFDVGEEVVSPYLWFRRIRRLDVVVLTHAHSDHMGGMGAVLRNFRPRELWVGIDPQSAAYEALLLEAKELGVAVRHFRAGDRVSWRGVEVLALAPAVGYGNIGAPKNDDSLVLRLDFGKGSVLLEGDAEKGSEASMLAGGLVTPVKLLKVGHHGSATSSGAEFLAAAAPEDAVVSAGRGNTFGHPRGEVVARFAGLKTRFYRTDEFGLTTFLLGRDGSVRVISGEN